jgi:undecaprenyl-diphosphatase
VLSFLQAAVLGLLQGVTELFPVSSLGHTVVFPALFGWHGVVAAQSAKESYFLAFLVGLHVATALALLIYFRKDWVRIISGLFRSLAKRKIETPDERLAWLLVVATLPAGVTGLALEHVFRVIFAKPVAAAAFLMVNGFILFGGDRLRRRSLAARTPVPAGELAAGELSASQGSAGQGSDGQGLAGQGLAGQGLAGQGAAGGARRPVARRELATLEFREAVLIGSFQVLALFAGISRAGVTMVGGLLRGLDYEDSARFSFLLATPIILAAGVYKVHDLVGVNGNGVRPQILVGSLVAFVSAYLAVRFLMRFFETRTLRPFAIYSLAFGAAMVVRFTVF